jgi:hypothetical protein
MKKCSLSLAIKQMQIRTSLRFHLSPVRIATIKNTNDKCVLEMKMARMQGKKNPQTLLVVM